MGTGTSVPPKCVGVGNGGASDGKKHSKNDSIEPKTDMDRILLGRTKDFKELRVSLCIIYS